MTKLVANAYTLTYYKECIIFPITLFILPSSDNVFELLNVEYHSYTTYSEIVLTLLKKPMKLLV